MQSQQATDGRAPGSSAPVVPERWPRNSSKFLGCASGRSASAAVRSRPASGPSLPPAPSANSGCGWTLNFGPFGGAARAGITQQRPESRMDRTPVSARKIDSQFSLDRRARLMISALPAPPMTIRPGRTFLPRDFRFATARMGASITRRASGEAPECPKNLVAHSTQRKYVRPRGVRRNSSRRGMTVGLSTGSTARLLL